MDCYLLIADSKGTEKKWKGPLLKLPNQPSTNECVENFYCIPQQQVYSTFEGSPGAYPFTRKQIFIHMQIKIISLPPAMGHFLILNGF